MAYNPNIPQPTDNMSRSQQGFLDNFQALYQLYKLDHKELDAVDEVGYHEKMSLVQQGSGPTTLATESALYTKLDGSVDNLYVRQQSNGTEIQITDAANHSINILPRPRVAAAWEWSGVAIGTITLLGNQVNVASVVSLNAAGSAFRITFDSALSSADYYVLGNYDDNSSPGNPYGGSVPNYQNATTTTLDIYAQSVTLGFGPINYFVMVWL